MWEFLGEHRVDRDPARVAYVRDPREDNATGLVVADHAYWLSRVTVRNAGAAPTGTIDVRPAAFGRGEQPVLPVTYGNGVMPGGSIPMAHVDRLLTWGDAAATPMKDALTIAAQNIGSVAIDVRRARVSCAAQLDVTTDGPLTVVLKGCDRTVRFERTE